jgi:hypothetical protein
MVASIRERSPMPILGGDADRNRGWVGPLKETPKRPAAAGLALRVPSADEVAGERDLGDAVAVGQALDGGVHQGEEPDAEGTP